LTPELSVIVVVGSRRARGAGCLESVLGQDLGERLEVVLVDLDSTAAPLAQAADRRVNTLHLRADTSFAAARIAGIEAARGGVVAFLEEHCRALPSWGAALLRAYASGPWAGVGSRVENANPGQGVSDITGLLAYHHFYSPLESGEVEFLPGHNASFRRDVLLAYRDRLPLLLRSDIVLHQRLRADGHRLFIAADAAIEHLNEVTTASRGRGVGLWYRLFAHSRYVEFDWSNARRLAYVLASPAVPLYYAWTVWSGLRKRRPQYLPLFYRNPWTVALSGMVAGRGMASGLLLGPGDAEARFSRFEMEEWRGEPAPDPPSS
jgi:glycosyltransferase involved in cell wall biosynthesis